jgi:hypothetical protein
MSKAALPQRAASSLRMSQRGASERPSGSRVTLRLAVQTAARPSQVAVGRPPVHEVRRAGNLAGNELYGGSKQEEASARLTAPVVPVRIAVEDSRTEQEGGRASAYPAHAPLPVLAPPVLLQRKCACGGYCPGCEREQKNDPVHQAKLTVNAPGDRYEQEADRVASAVVGSDSASPSAPVLVASRVIHRMAGPAPPLPHEARVGGSPPVQAERSRGRPPPRAASVEQRILARQGYGSPMPGAVLQFMESRLNADFSDIRIHTDSESHALNQDLHAYAFTAGSDIFFAEGQYRPGTSDGNRLLAHELAHVIQQSAAPVRGTRVQTQRIGNWAHQKIQDRLIKENSDLMCEVHIPGALSPDTDEGTGFDEDRLDVRGYADLYRNDSNLVSGIRSVPAHEGDPDAIGDPPRKYFNVGKAKTRKILGATPKYGPRVKSRRPYVWNDNPSFPKAFEIGELKPLYLEQFPLNLATAMLQVAAYTQGFEAFARRAAKDSGYAIKVIPSGSPMPIKWRDPKAIKIPAELDLNQKKKQAVTPAAGKAVLKGNKRLWVMADPDEKGVLRYLLLPHPSPPSSAGQDADTQDAKLQPILIPIKKPPEKWPDQPQRKAKPGAPPDRTLFVQRDSVPADLTGTWKDQWTTWEKSRQEWSGTPKTAGSATEFLKKEGEARKEELDAEAKLKIPSTETELVPQERIKLRRIERWAGRSGWFLGLLRFRFGALFDRAGALFKKIGKKFASFSDSAKTGSSLGGWQKKAVDLIGEALILMLKTLASQAFQIAVNCVYGIASNILNYFIDEAREELQKILDPIREKFEQLRQKLEGFEPIIDGVSKVLSALDKVRNFASMLSDIEWGLRLLIEAISCATPPALGCLWGLISQIGFDLAAAKAIGTNLFRTRIAEPAARSLLDATGVGDRIRSFISSAVDTLPLPPEVKAVAACQKPGPILAGEPRLNRDNMKFSNADPEVVKARKELESANAPHTMIEDLERALASGGKQATGVEIQQLLKEFQDSKLSPGEFMKRFKTGKGGKVDIQGGAGQSELALPATAVLKMLQAADNDWDKVAPGSFKIDLRHTPPRFLAKTKDKLRFGALIHVTESGEKGKVIITESGQLILVDKLGPDQAIAAEVPKKGTMGGKDFVFWTGVGNDKPGDVLQEGDFLRGMTFNK